MAAFGRAVDLDGARAAVAPLRLVEIDEFAAAHALPEQLLALQGPPALTTLATHPAALDYFGAVRERSGRAAGGDAGGGDVGEPQPLRVALPSFGVATVREAFGACDHHGVLAFSRLAPVEYDDEPPRAPPPAANGSAPVPPPPPPAPIGWHVAGRPARQWVEQIALPALLAPSTPLADAAEVRAPPHPHPL
eukprot:5149327-Prymnesium_polylepis.1